LLKIVTFEMETPLCIIYKLVKMEFTTSTMEFTMFTDVFD